MMRSFTSVLLLLAMTTSAPADDYVVELECVVFDRVANDEEKKRIQAAAEGVPQHERGTTRAEEEFRLLREAANVRHSVECSLLMKPGHANVQKVHTKGLGIVWRAEIKSIEKATGTLHVQGATSFVVNERQMASTGFNHTRDVPIGRWEYPSGFAGNGFSAHFRVRIRPATEEDRHPKQEIELDWPPILPARPKGVPQA